MCRICSLKNQDPPIGDYRKFPPTHLKTVRLRNARLADMSLAYTFSADGDGQDHWQEAGNTHTNGEHFHEKVQGLLAFAKALASAESCIDEVDIKGFLSAPAMDAFLPSEEEGEEATQDVWDRINDKGVRFSLNLNGTLNPENTRVLQEKCRLLKIDATGNSYAGDGIDRIIALLNDPEGENLTEISVDGTSTTDFELLKLLAAILAHEKMEKVTIVWLAADRLTALAKELLALNVCETDAIDALDGDENAATALGHRRSMLDSDEYYRRHHNINFSDRRRLVPLSQRVLLR